MNSVLAKVGKVPAHLLSTQEDSDFEFWRYADLEDRRIVTDRADYSASRREVFHAP